METIKDIALVLLSAISISAPIYFKSYLTEKAKSDVQKSDIEELTQKVESVKAIYSKENEELKFQLNQLLNLTTLHRTEERNALIKFYTAYIHWIYLFFDINLSDFNRQNLNELSEKKLSLNNFFYNIHIERANVLLIVNDQTIVDKTYDLIRLLISYKAFIEQNLLSLQHLLTKNENSIESFLKLKYDNPGDRLKMEKIATDDRDERLKLQALIENFQKNRSEEFLKCKFPSDEFAKITKNYLVTINS